MKDVRTHSGNQLREFYYWASLRNPSDRGHLAHKNKGAGFAMQAVYSSTCENTYTNGSKRHNGLCLLWKMSLQASCLGLLPHKEGLLVGSPNHAPLMSRRWESMGKAPFGVGEGVCRPQSRCAGSSQGNLHPLPKCLDTVPAGLSFNTSPCHQTVLVSWLSLHVPN